MWRPAADRGWDDGGFSLVEVVVAAVVLMVVLLPVADLLTTTSQVVAGSQFRVQAQDLATADLVAAQSLAGSEPAMFVADFGAGSSPGIAGPPVQLDQAADSGGSLQWSTADPQATTVQGQHYQVVADGGWCTTASSTPTSTSTQWGTSGTGPPAFVVVVLAAWGRPQAGTDIMAEPHVVDSGAIRPPAGWELPQEPSSFFAWCPAGLS